MNFSHFLLEVIINPDLIKYMSLERSTSPFFHVLFLHFRGLTFLSPNPLASAAISENLICFKFNFEDASKGFVFLLLARNSKCQKRRQREAVVKFKIV